MKFFSKPSIAWQRRLCAGMLLLIVLTRVSAEEDGVETVATSLSLSQVLSRVIQDSPELAVFPYHLRAAEARALQASLRPNPELSLEVENIAGDGEFSGTDSAEVTLALSQVIELGGKRRYRQDVARLGGHIVQRDYDVARLAVLANAANRFLDVVWAQALLQLAEQSATWAKTAEGTAQARLRAGSASRAELSQTRIETFRATLAVSEVQNRLASARQRLAAQWGAERADFDGVRAEVFSLNEVPDFQQLRDQIEQSPQLKRYLTLDRLRQAELDLAIAQGRQNLNVGLGVRHDKASGDQGLTLEFSMPLGISNRNQGGIREARADLERLDSERAATRILIYGELHRLYQQLQQARRTVEVLREQALPEAERALTQIEKGYRQGRFSYLELLEMHRQRLTVSREAIDAAVAFHRALLTLEQITGESLTEPTHSILLPKRSELHQIQDEEK